jgi:hypothetical protein
MKGGVPKNAIMDGQWHLVEWNLDLAGDWGAALGIGGAAGALPNGTWTIDSIMPRYAVGTTWPGYTGLQDIQIDFVAKSDMGSIAGLLNSPPTVSDDDIGQVLRNVGTQNLGPLPAVDPESGTLTWSLVSVNAPGPFDLADFVVDPVTGQLDFNSVQEELGTYQVTLRATDPGGLSDDGVLTFEVVIPEPASFTLLGLALVGSLGFLRRR